MNKCINVVAHINRLEGQLRALSTKLEAGSSCDDLVHLTLSASKSFDSLKAKIIEGYLKQNLIKNSKKVDYELQSLLKLIK